MKKAYEQNTAQNAARQQVIDLDPGLSHLTDELLRRSLRVRTIILGLLGALSGIAAIYAVVVAARPEVAESARLYLLMMLAIFALGVVTIFALVSALKAAVASRLTKYDWIGHLERMEHRPR